MEALILAGGFGTRLRSVLHDTPKPMAPIAGKPFLAYILDDLLAQGCTSVYLSLYHLATQFQHYFGHKYQTLNIHYIIEPEPLGTGGAIQYALSLIKSTNTLLVINGDTLLRLDYKKLQQQHYQHQSLVTLSLVKQQNCIRYGRVLVDNNIVTGFSEKGVAEPGWINGGIYCLSPHLFDNTSLPKIFSFETDYLMTHLQHIQPSAFCCEDYFIDIGIPSDHQRAQQELPILYAQP